MIINKQIIMNLKLKNFYQKKKRYVDSLKTLIIVKIEMRNWNQY